MAATDNFAGNGIRRCNRVQRLRFGTLADDQASAILANISILALKLF
jgi:hypothetical protein